MGIILSEWLNKDREAIFLVKGSAMKFLVAYMSETGNTQKVAKAIYNKLPIDKDIKTLNDIENLYGYDLVFVGFPIHSFGAPVQAKRFLKKYCHHKKVALFVTHASSEEYSDLPLWLENCRLAAKGSDLVGMFNCQGEMAPELIELVKNSMDRQLRFFGAYGSLTKGLPHESDLQRAGDFTRQMTNALEKSG